MRIAHIADVHLDRPFAGMRGDAGEHARQRLRDTFRRCLGLAVARKVDLITIGGDLWEDENVRVDTRRFVAHELGQTAIPAVLICGNHDPYLAGGNYARTEWPSNVKLVSSAQPAEHRFGDDVSVWGLSWTGEGLRAEFLETFRVPADRRHVLLIHGTSTSVPYFAEQSNHCPFSPSSVRAAGFDLCLAGHIHAASVRDAVVYPGSPEPLGWSETGDHCVAIVDVGETVDVDLVPINEDRYEGSELDCTGCDSSGMVEERLRSQIPSEDRARLHLRVDLCGDVDSQCEIRPTMVADGLAADFAELIVNDATTPDYDLDHIAQQETVRGIFVRDIRARLGEESDEQKREKLELALKAGLRALDGRKDVVRVD